LLLTLLSAGQGTAAAGADVGRVIERLLPALWAYSAAQLVYWSEDELYEYANDALKSLAVTSGMFAERDDSISVLILTGQYDLPKRNLFTVHVAFDSIPLRRTGIQSLEALHDDWPLTLGTPEKYMLNYSGVNTIRIYPIPTEAGSLHIVQRVYPPEVSPASSTVSAPRVVEDYLWWQMLRRAHIKESDGAMPEVAAFALEPIQWMEAMFSHYWGG